MLQVTENAARHIKEIMQKEGLDNEQVRLFVEGFG